MSIYPYHTHYWYWINVGFNISDGGGGNFCNTQNPHTPGKPPATCKITVERYSYTMFFVFTRIIIRKSAIKQKNYSYWLLSIWNQLLRYKNDFLGRFQMKWWWCWPRPTISSFSFKLKYWFSLLQSIANHFKLCNLDVSFHMCMKGQHFRRG